MQVAHMVSAMPPAAIAASLASERFFVMVLDGSKPENLAAHRQRGTAAWWTTFWHPHELVADELSLPLEENEFCLTLCSASQRFRALQYEPSHVEQLAMSAEHESSDVSPVNVAAGMQCAAGGARASEVHIECIGANSAAAFASTRCANEAVDRLRAPRDCQARARCVRWKTGMPRCHSAVPMQNEQYGLSQGGLLRSGRNYVFALCGPLQQRRRRQSADTGEASMGDGRDKIRWPLSMPSHDQWAAIPPARRPRANGKWKQWYDVREGTARTQACVGGTAAVWCGVRG